MTRVLMWVESEQDAYWRGQIRKAEETVSRCKEAVRMKTVFKDASGRQQSAVDEQKALQIALKRLAETQSKLVVVRRWVRQLQKEIELYKGGVQRFATSLHSEIPSAAAHLESLSAKLDAYLSVQATDIGGAAGGEASSSAGPSMTRGGVGLGGASETSAILPIPSIPPDQYLQLSERGIDRQAPPDQLPLLVNVQPGEVFPSNCGEKRWRGSWRQYQDTRLFDEAISIPVSQAIHSRPDLAELLSLPVGFSVIMDSAGIVEVLDPGQLPVWRRRDPDDRPKQPS